MGKRTLKAHCTTSVLWSLEVFRCNRLSIESRSVKEEGFQLISFFSINKQRILCISERFPTHTPFLMFGFEKNIIRCFLWLVIRWVLQCRISGDGGRLPSLNQTDLGSVKGIPHLTPLQHSILIQSTQINHRSLLFIEWPIIFFSYTLRVAVVKSKQVKLILRFIGPQPDWIFFKKPSGLIGSWTKVQVCCTENGVKDVTGWFH